METKKRINSEVSKVRSNLISIFLINTVVLFTLSLIGFIYLNSSSIENYFKENVTINIYLKNDTKESENKQLIKLLRLNEDVKDINYLSKEDAAKIFSSEIGEEFVGFLGYNPLLDAVSVQLKGDKIDIYFIDSFIDNLNDFEFIEDSAIFVELRPKTPTSSNFKFTIGPSLNNTCGDSSVMLSDTWSLMDPNSLFFS